MSQPSVTVALLSMGDRPAELADALQGIAEQTGVDWDVVLVGNGWDPSGVPDWVKTYHVAENCGVPGGRNVAAQLATGEFIFFYDDDGSLPSPDLLRRMVDKMDERVAVVQPRVVDPTGLPSPRRWTPRLRASTANEAGDVVVFAEGMAMIRRSAFEEVGGWPGEFFFGHEGIDLAMRLLDHGWRIRYEPSIVVNHPAKPATRHAVYYRNNARNRAWVARRNLPWPLVPVYLGVWAGATLVRERQVANLREWFGGLREGLTSPIPGTRKPISLKTIWTMTRLGRPPLW